MQLNAQQTIAATHIEGPMMVLAGPGTGKTQIIAARVAQILEQTQMEPHNVLCLTFTESGVAAMRKRLLSMVGTAAYHVRIHTFHSFCNDVIKDHPERFLFARELEPLGDVERIQIFRQLMDQLPGTAELRPFGDPYFYVKHVMRAIQELKREDISPHRLLELVQGLEAFLVESGPHIEAFVSTHARKLVQGDFEGMQDFLAGSPASFVFSGELDLSDSKTRTRIKNLLKKTYVTMQKQLPKQKELIQLYEAYNEALNKRGRYDFEDMILFVVKAFQEDQELLAYYQEQFQYILVDEYQDTNGAQNEVLKLITDYFDVPNLFVVGDDKQSIYRFQGASLENLLYFYRLYQDNIELVSLKENYRSQQNILDAAHSVIEQNQESVTHYIPELSTALHANRQAEDIPVRLGAFDQLSSEHYFLAREVQRLIEEGVNPSEIAILYRNNWEVQDLVDLFIRLGVPFQLEAGDDVLKDTRIEQLLQLLNVVQNPEDGEQLFYVLHFDFLAFKSLDIARLTRQAASNRQSLFEAMLESELFADFAQQLLEWQRVSINEPLINFFEQVLKESGFLEFTMKAENKLEALNRLNTLFDEVKQLNRQNHALRLEELKDYFTLLKENQIPLKEHTLKTQRKAVRLMTAHKSKGLEFDYVFIMHLVDGTWGNPKTRRFLELPQGILKYTHKEDRNEDERRLFYVAMTRAKKQVTLSYAQLRENGRPNVPSIFLEELDASYLDSIDTSAIEDEALERLKTLFLTPPQPLEDPKEKEFVRTLLENYTMSATHLNNYLKCPRLFYYNNLLRVPRAKSKFEVFGTAVHESLKDLALAEEATREFLLEQFEKHLRRDVLSQQDFRGGLDIGREALAEYYENYAPSAPSSLPEYNFASHGVHLDGIPLTGKLDSIELTDPSTKHVHVVDYKTGNPDNKKQALGPDGDYKRQILFYQLLCNLSPKFPYKMVSGEIRFVQKSKRDGQFKRQVYEVSAEELEQLKSTIKDVYQDIMGLKFLHPDEWSTCGECEYCLNFGVKA